MVKGKLVAPHVVDVTRFIKNIYGDIEREKFENDRDYFADGIKDYVRWFWLHSAYTSSKQ